MKCKYCGKEMERIESGDREHDMVFYECPNCGIPPEGDAGEV
jgi:predicted RNA-binding Zn-ribbon protein involved in translation (DUF1610 family)